MHSKNNNNDAVEAIILKLADYIYGHMNLKPISKSIFFISRAFLTICKYGSSNLQELIDDYEALKVNSLNKFFDDFDFTEMLIQNRAHIGHIITELNNILKEDDDGDFTGKVFNSLLRGKYEAGEGMGSFLTPSEVSDPMIKMVFDTRNAISKKSVNSIADISGGTGRFLISAKEYLNAEGFKNKDISKLLYSYDQSSLHNSLNKINFEFFEMNPSIFDVTDSLLHDSLKRSKQFDILITNPPFGKNKYKYSPEISDNFSIELLKKINFYKKGQSIDPCELFFLKNLILLNDEGILGIILPDGFVKSKKIEEYLNHLNVIFKDKFKVMCSASLPKETFSLTGTVALSSFLIITKNSKKIYSNSFQREVQKIGFKKSGNKKVYIDENDLPKFLNQYKSFLDDETTEEVSQNTFKNIVSDFVTPKNIPFSDAGSEELHISILDIDDTGFLDINSALKNKPISQTKVCCAGDILVSCLNPRKWRALLVPNIFSSVSCSNEFLVITPKNKIDPLDIYFSLFSKDFQNRALKIAKGTSSSRQRINKNEFLNLPFNLLKVKNRVQLLNMIKQREKIYLNRAKEVKIFSSF